VQCNSFLTSFQLALLRQNFCGLPEEPGPHRAAAGWLGPAQFSGVFLHGHRWQVTLSWTAGVEQHLQHQEGVGEQGPQTSAAEIPDPWGNMSLLVKGGNGVLEYSNIAIRLTWQS